MHKFDLKDKTAVITGGAPGFGLDIAKKFYRNKATCLSVLTEEDYFLGN